MRENQFVGNEKGLVVNPLKKYFLNQKRSGARWRIKAEPDYERFATGWDLQVERHNQVLLIEAKYFNKSFISSFAGLVSAPLTNRSEKMKSKKKKSWSAVVCWAVGSGYKDRNIYQILFDYLVRDIIFYKAYSKILKVKYIYFVSDGCVAKISFKEILRRASWYKHQLNKLKEGIDLNQKRKIVNQLMGNLKFK